MKPFTPRFVALAAFSSCCMVMAPVPSSAATPPFTSEKAFYGAIDFQQTQLDPIDFNVVHDAGFPAIANSYPAVPARPVASYLGDGDNGRFAANVDVDGGRYAASRVLYTETVTNASDHALDLTFNFYLRPGQVQVLASPTAAYWEGTASMFAGIAWDTPERVAFTPLIWTASADVLGDANSGFSNISDATLGPVFERPDFVFKATDAGFTYDAFQHKIHLATLGVGETKVLEYFMNVSAYYSEQQGCGCEPGTFAAVRDVAGHSVAGAYDPFGIVETRGIKYLAVAVPEPQIWVVLALGLIAVVAVARRPAAVGARATA